MFLLFCLNCFEVTSKGVLWRRNMKKKKVIFIFFARIILKCVYVSLESTTVSQPMSYFLWCAPSPVLGGGQDQAYVRLMHWLTSEKSRCDILGASILWTQPAFMEFLLVNRTMCCPDKSTCPFLIALSSSPHYCKHHFLLVGELPVYLFPLVGW